jgi:hypothetical protein
MTTVERAEQTLLTHAADEDGLCGFCRLHFHLRIVAGKCAPYLQTAAFIAGRRRAQALRRLRVVFSRPARPVSPLPPGAAVSGVRRPLLDREHRASRWGAAPVGWFPGRRVCTAAAAHKTPGRLVDGRARPGRATPGARPGPM